MASLLVNRSWWKLRGVAQAHGQRFNTHLNREQGCKRLRDALLQGGGLKRAFRALSPTEREALLVLQAAEGSMSLGEFTARFGIIRRFRPWREDSPRHPWKRPVSTAEKLWHLAFIEISDSRVLLVDEAATLLPPPPRPRKAVLPHRVYGQPENNSDFSSPSLLAERGLGGEGDSDPIASLPITPPFSTRWGKGAGGNLPRRLLPG